MVKLFLSGGVTNAFPITSIGGVKSTTEIVDANLNNLWDDVNRVEVINGRTEYRMFYINNDDGQDYLKARLITLVIPVDTEISFAMQDPNATPQLLATEDITPIGLTFFKFDEYNSLKIPWGTFNDGADIAIWIKRKVIVGSDSLRTISMTIDGIDNAITIGGDFGSIENTQDNIFIKSRSSQFFCDIDFSGEALLS